MVAVSQAGLDSVDKTKANAHASYICLQYDSIVTYSAIGEKEG